MIIPINNLKDFADKDPWMQKLRTNSFGIILPSGWFGRPFDNQHSINDIIVINDHLSIVFDDIRKIEIVDPRSSEIQTNGPYSSLKLYGSREITFSWIPYGEENSGKTVVNKFNSAEGNTFEFVG